MGHHLRIPAGTQSKGNHVPTVQDLPVQKDHSSLPSEAAGYLGQETRRKQEA